MRRRHSGVGVAFAVLSICCALAGASRARAFADEKGPTYRVDDVSLVYLGNPRQFKKPAEVSADRVYRAIPEYKEILDKNLTDKDVRYHFLMKKASEKFSKSVDALGRDFSYDLVAGKGAVILVAKDAPVVPDATDAAIARLPT
jgi:hypothetical protein